MENEPFINTREIKLAGWFEVPPGLVGPDGFPDETLKVTINGLPFKVSRAKFGDHHDNQDGSFNLRHTYKYDPSA